MPHADDFSPATPRRPDWPFGSAAPRRIVYKLGSNLLSLPSGVLDAGRIGVAAREIAALRAAGSQVVVVSSGAVAAGMGAMGITERPVSLARLQAMAAIGQGHLMKAWIDAFVGEGVATAQMLLTRSDLEDRQRHLNARETLEALLAEGAVPVINENDTVVTDELTIGDNDMLSAIIAVKMQADLLVILTDIDGLYTGNPKTDSAARLIETVDEVTPEIELIAQGPGSRVGRGGMVTKVAAARHATRFGVATIVANGRAENIVASAARGTFRGTFFPPRTNGKTRGRARSHWISMHKPRGAVVIDDGARRALIEQGRSLLPVGVVAVDGAFGRGDVIAVRDAGGIELARGISNFASSEIDRILGAHAEEIEDRLGMPAPQPEVIHRDNLLVGGR